MRNIRSIVAEAVTDKLNEYDIRDFLDDAIKRAIENLDFEDKLIETIEDKLSDELEAHIEEYIDSALEDAVESWVEDKLGNM